MQWHLNKKIRKNTKHANIELGALEKERHEKDAQIILKNWKSQEVRTASNESGYWAIYLIKEYNQRSIKNQAVNLFKKGSTKKKPSISGDEGQ